MLFSKLLTPFGKSSSWSILQSGHKINLQDNATGVPGRARTEYTGRGSAREIGGRWEVGQWVRRTLDTR